MNISTAFIKRPVATSLLCLGLVLAGAVALWLLPVAPLPQADVPTIKVSASLPGASPETMASTVALPLERALGRIAGVTEMSSTSTTGATSIRLTFDLARPPQGAARDVQAALNTARAELPSDLPASPSYRAVSSADAPIMVLALTSHELAPAQIYAAADNFVRILTQVDGVGEVELVGSSPPAVQVALDPNALNRHGLGIPAVRRAVGAATPNLPLGTIAAAGRQWQVVTSSPLSSAAALAEVPVAWRDGAALRLADVAQVAPGQRDPYHTGLANGAPAVLAIVHRKPDANILKTLQRIDARMPALRAALPGNVAASVVVDRATTIRASMRAAGHTLAIAMLLVALVMLAFLRDLRAALIASAAAPIALAGALAVMYALGYSLDNLSLMALTIAIGFAVDDAVVVVENIARHVEAGEPPASAARTGAGEIGLTVLAMSLVLVAVFIPLLFMGGYAGLFVREFAGTIAIVIAVSLLVSLTVVPMLCAKWLRPVATGTAPRGPRARIRAALDALLAAYMRSLAWVLRHQLATLVVLGAVVALNVLLFVVTPKGFFPRQDTGELTGSMTVDHGGSFQVTRAQLARFAAIVRADPAVQSVAAYAHRANGTLFATLLPLGQRDASADAVAARLRRRLAAVPGASFAVQALQDIRVGGRRSRSSDQYTIEADTAATLQQWAPRIARALAALPELREVTVESAGTGVQTVLDVDATAAARHGVSLRTIAGTLHDGFAEPAVAVLYAGAGRTYPVVLNLAPAHIQSPAALTDLAVAGAGNAGVPLADVATISQRGAPLAVDHLGQFNAVTISFVPAPGVALSTATRAIERAVAALALPNAVRGSFQGSAQAFRQAAGSEPALLGAALLTLFIVLGVLYESLAHPLTILSTLPSAGVGALLALLALRMDFSVIALIGVFALIGIVMKNAIMMVDFALHAQRTTGASPEAAIAEACRLRFRPILMTSLAVFLAAIPLAILHGDGAEMRQPLGVAIGGGLVVSQLLTLYTTPVVYLYLDRGGHWMRRRFGMLAAHWRAGAVPPAQEFNP